MVAREYMQPFHAVAPDATVWAAFCTMRDHDIRCLLVVEDHALVGIVSNRDFRRLLEQPRPDGALPDLSTVTVAEIMTTGPLVTVQPETHIVEVAKLIVADAIGCVPVVESAQGPIGVLTQKAVLGALVELLT